MSADLKESSVPLAEISQGPNAFEAFLDRNQKGIVVLAIFLALAAVAAVIYRGIERSRQESAGAELNKAEDLAAYQKVVDESAGTTAAGSALVLLANSQWSAGKKDDAVASLRKFIATYPEHPAIPSAKANLGSKLMAQGKTGDATKVFDDLAEDPAAKFIAPFALVSLGDIAKAGGDLEKAEATYAKVSTEFPDSTFSETATRRVATLRAKPPAEIEAPPAPPAATPPPSPKDPGESIKAAMPPGVTVTPSAPPAPEPAPEPAPAPESELAPAPPAPTPPAKPEP